MTTTVHESAAIEAARQAQKRAHAPYSGKYVGAAVVTTDGQVFAACNVENVDSTLRICAERNAIAQAIASGQRSISTIVVVGPDTRFWPPCDLCRAVIAEFVDNPRMILSTADGHLHIDHLNSLPVYPFSPNGQEPPA